MLFIDLIRHISCSTFQVKWNKLFREGEQSWWNTCKLWDKKENIFCQRLFYTEGNEVTLYTIVLCSQASSELGDAWSYGRGYLCLFGVPSLRAMCDRERWRRPWKRWRAWLLNLASKILGPLVPLYWPKMTWHSKQSYSHLSSSLISSWWQMTSIWPLVAAILHLNSIH